MKSLKSILKILAFVLILSGCQTVADFIGSGPITLSDSVANHYQNKYLKGVGPQYYVVAADGNNASYTYCAAGTGMCQFGLVVLDSIASCEKRSGQKCYIFDEGSYVVWKGPVSYGGGSTPKSARTTPMPAVINKEALAALPDKALCNYALEGMQWSTSRSFIRYVEEAKSRGLTPIKCSPNRVLPTRTTPIPFVADKAAMAAFPDKALCNRAVEGPYWSKLSSYKRYVEEARSRGLTPEKCWNLTN